MNLQALVMALMDDEGHRTNARGRHILYKCPADKWTIGYGRNLEDNGISETEAVDILASDAIQAQRDAAALIPNWLALDPVRQNVCANLAFQLGQPGLAKFVKFLAATNNGKYHEAAMELRDSKWFVQSGNRSKRLVAEMETGVVK